jgi:hypothetical protein
LVVLVLNDPVDSGYDLRDIHRSVIRADLDVDDFGVRSNPKKLVLRLEVVVVINVGCLSGDDPRQVSSVPVAIEVLQIGILRLDRQIRSIEDLSRM